MLIVNPARVATGLRLGTISEESKARIIIVGYVVTLVLGGRSLPGYRTWGELLLSAAYLGAALGGFWSCFQANQSGDGRAFVERYMCIGVPVSVLVFGSYTVVYYAAFFALRGRPGYDAASYANSVRPYFLLLSFAALAIFFLTLRRFIRRVSDAPAI